MKKSLLLIIFNLFAALVTEHVYGQYNYLDTGFADFLNNKYPSCIVYHVPNPTTEDPGGYTIDSTCSIIQHVDSLNISGLGIQNLEGIEYFTSLTYLNCSNNQIYQSPALPSTLTYLDISNNASFEGPFSYLPPLPNSLTYLDCSDYSDGGEWVMPDFSLPTLPPSLSYLKCSNVGLYSLPSLPNSLIYLDCSSQVNYTLTSSPRILQSLPVLPPSLTYLNCSENELSSLPTLPASLNHLDCSGVFTYDINDVISSTLFCLPRLPQSLNFLAIPSSVNCIPDSVNGLQIEITSNNYLDTGHFVSGLPICTSNCINSTNTILCPPITYTTFPAGIIGLNYQWQLSTDSIHFINLSNDTIYFDYLGTNTYILQLNNIVSSHYGYQYRCLVDGDTSVVYTITFADIWTDVQGSGWENVNNWSCGAIPDANTDVYINSGSVVLSSNETVRSLTVSPNASFTIATGYTLTISH